MIIFSDLSWSRWSIGSVVVSMVHPSLDDICTHWMCCCICSLVGIVLYDFSSEISKIWIWEILDFKIQQLFIYFWDAYDFILRTWIWFLVAPYIKHRFHFHIETIMRYGMNKKYNRFENQSVRYTKSPTTQSPNLSYVRDPFWSSPARSPPTRPSPNKPICCSV